MSSSDQRRRKAAGPVLLIACLGLLAGCTAGPLYGAPDALRVAAPGGAETSLRGRIAVAPAGDRTTQIVRNALIFQLNGGERPVNPLYQVRLAVSGVASGVSIQTGTGAPTASIYNMVASYQVVRVSDQKVVASGRRTSLTPFDQASTAGIPQQFAAERALLDARQQAGEDVAAKVSLAISAALRKLPG